MKNYYVAILAIFFSLFIAPSLASASLTESGNSLYVNEDKIIEGNYYVAGANITIDGRITGDVYCAGQSVIINGTIDGDVVCAGQSIIINGQIGGNLRAIASNINLNGKITRNLTVAGASVNLGKKSQIGWDALIAAANVQAQGEIGRSLLGAGANYNLDGKTNGDVKLYLDNNSTKNETPELVIGDGASINGQLTYTSMTNASISEKAQIKNEVIHKTTPLSKPAKSSMGALYVFIIIAILSALVIGLVIISLWKKPTLKITDTMNTKFWQMVGWGFIFTILTPIAIFIIAISIIGFRLALIIMWIWLISLMVSKIMASIAIGRLLLENFWTKKQDSLVIAMIGGITISWIIFYIPIIGWLFSLVAVWWGMGGLIIYLKSLYDEQ